MFDFLVCVEAHPDRNTVMFKVSEERFAVEK